jgi:hypothetical protein
MLCFPPMRANRANLIETKNTSLNTPEERCRLNGVAVLVVSILSSRFGASFASKSNESVSVTAGRTFVSTETMQNPPPGPADSFREPGNFAFNYGRFLLSRKHFRTVCRIARSLRPADESEHLTEPDTQGHRSLFVTPSLRLNVFSSDSVTPWVSVGGGYGRFRYAPSPLFEGPNPTYRHQYRRITVRSWSWMCGYGIAGERGSKRATSTLENPT